MSLYCEEDWQPERDDQAEDQNDAFVNPVFRSENAKEVTFTKSLGGSPGLVVMGDDSCSKGRGFESRRRKLDGHFFTFICCKNCNVCLKKTENKTKKRPELAQFKKKHLLKAGQSQPLFGLSTPHFDD